MNDSTSCFRRLVDNVPLWIRRVDEIANQLERRQADLADADAASKKRADSDTSSYEEHRPSPKRQRTTENRRARSGSSGTIGRKSSQASRMVVVYYDPAFQQTMIDLVRDIGSSRNELRKARMASRFKFASAPSLLAEDEEDGGDLMAKLRLQRTMRSRGPNGAGPVKDVYEKTDGFLEKAQAMCETAAHQFLRDGASRTELDAAKAQLGEALREAGLEKQRIDAEEAKAKEEEVTEDEDSSMKTADEPTTPPLAQSEGLSFPLKGEVFANPSVPNPLISIPLASKQHETKIEDIAHEVDVTRITDDIVNRRMDPAARDGLWDSKPMTVAPI